MFSAVLFDLDGTLLDIQLDVFLRAYFTALGPVIATVAGPGVSPRDALDAVMAGTRAMSEDESPRTNREVFNERFEQLTGGDLNTPEAELVIDRFYAEEFPALQESHGARRDGVGAVLAARKAGMTTVLATNPIFPLAAIRERMRWAELQESWFEFVTSYETSTSCKPAHGYYREIAQRLSIAPEQCLMVGDDPVLDMAAADIGMKTFFVGCGPSAEADWHGNLSDVRSLLLSVAPIG
jgi:HAD superfamily hydrolase (TIGR01549 family)